MKTWNQNAVIRGAIRRAFSRAPVKQEVLKAARKEFPKFNKDGSRSKKDAVCYLCNVCKEYKGSTIVSVDHIEGVIGPDGFLDWNIFVSRVFCSKENLQVICDMDHQIKTNKERFERTLNKEYRELAAIQDRLINRQLTKEDNKFVKRFTPKRLQKYPEDFVSKITQLKELLNAKDQNKK